MKSYSSETHGLRGWYREITGLYRLHAQDLEQRVRNSIEDARRVQARLEDRFGIQLRGLKMLEIGPGQFLGQLTYFATRNEVVGIDRDIIVQGFKPLSYVHMLSSNGPSRTLKTLGRKLLGVDRQYSYYLKKELGVNSLPKISVHAMDACATDFPSGSFDCVYTRAVLHHLPNPEKAVDEIVRVLRPGGVAYISLHPYTSQTGCLDPRIYTPQRDVVLGWPHLRPKLQSRVHPSNVYLNGLRVDEWKRLFVSRMPEAGFMVVPTDDLSAISRLQNLRMAGELGDYTDEELLAGDFVVLWHKPNKINGLALGLEAANASQLRSDPALQLP
jgi:SAM-dependent methyltransferase